MSRPPAGAPPVPPTSAVAQRPGNERRDMITYRTVAEGLRRPDRMAELKALLGGTDQAVEHFISVALHAVATNQQALLNADPMSIIMSIKDAATLGLEPTGLTGEGAIIVYGRTATFQPMWRGYLKRIRNSGKVQDVDCQIIYANDEFDYGWSEQGYWFKHHPAKLTKGTDGEYTVSRGDYWGVHAWAVMPSGYIEGEVMPIEDVVDVMTKFSPSVKAGKPGPWQTSFGEMSRKTVIKRLSKRLPQSAVDKLLEIDAKAEAAEAEANAAPRQDVTGAQRAVLAAVGLDIPAIIDGAVGGADAATDGADGQVDATAQSDAQSPGQAQLPFEETPWPAPQ